MMKKRLTVVAVLLFLILVALLLYRRSEPLEKKRIALVMKTLNNPFFVDMEKGAIDAAAKQDGVELIIQATQQDIDVEKQIQIVENLIIEGVGAICITPNESSGILPSLKKANEAGIPVVIVDTRINAPLAERMGVETSCFIGSDNYEGGRIAARYIAERTGGKGTVAVLEGVPGQETADSRRRGFTDALGDFPELQVVASQTADWDRHKGYPVTQNILQSHPRLDYIFGCNDEMALGAVEAVDAAGKKERVKVVGFDCTYDARRAIREGRMEGSVAQYPYEMGRIAIDTAAGLLRGKAPPRLIPTKVEMITREDLLNDG